MGLRAFIRRHHNVFSFDTREVEAEPGDEDMLEEEYGERAVEEEKSPGFVAKTRGGLFFKYWRTANKGDVSYDEIMDGEFEDDKQPLS